MDWGSPRVSKKPVPSFAAACIDSARGLSTECLWAARKALSGEADEAGAAEWGRGAEEDNEEEADAAAAAAR